MGAGNGILCFCQFEAHGFELPENKANRYIFKAVMARMTKILSSRARADLEFKNLEKVDSGGAIFLRLIFMEKITSLLSTGQLAATWNRGRLFLLEWDAL